MENQRIWGGEFSTNTKPNQEKNPRERDKGETPARKTVEDGKVEYDLIMGNQKSRGG